MPNTYSAPAAGPRPAPPAARRPGPPARRSAPPGAGRRSLAEARRPSAPAPRHAPSKSPVRTLILNLGVDLIAPIGVFYGLRAAGVSAFLAVLAGAAVPALGIAIRRKIDNLALFTMTILILTVAASLISGSPRMLLAKDGWLTAVAGIWILVTLFKGKPFVYEAARPIADARAASPELTWTARYNSEASFRHGMRVVTAAWGVALVLDAFVRAIMAYTLPVDAVPALSGIQYGVLCTALHIFGHVYGTQKGLIGDKAKRAVAPAASPGIGRPSQAGADHREPTMPSHA